MGAQASRRFLLAHLLIEHANQAFQLEKGGQRAVIFCLPHPPVRQQQPSECISDTFCRELFMNPCLSGWDRGEEKQAYMDLCHQVLSPRLEGEEGLPLAAQAGGA